MIKEKKKYIELRNVSILLLGKNVFSSYIKNFHGEMFHQEKHIERFSFERVSKSNKKKSSYNLCVCATLTGIRAPGFEDRLQEEL